MNITPLATPETPTTRSSELHATEFTSHDGTTIVRLVPTELLKAEELALASVGLNRGDDQIVGRTITRAVGFPAWPIITDSSPHSQIPPHTLSPLCWKNSPAFSST